MSDIVKPAGSTPALSVQEADLLLAGLRGWDAEEMIHLFEERIAAPSAREKQIASVVLLALSATHPTYVDLRFYIQVREESQAQFYARELVRMRPSLPVHNLSDEHLGALVELVVSSFPPSEDVHRLGVAIAPEDQRVWWERDQLVGALVARGSLTAIATLERLLSVQEEPQLRFALHAARVEWAQSERVPPAPSELSLLLQRKDRRLVRSANELLDVVREVLDDVQRDIVENGHLLWDFIPQDSKGRTSPPAQACPKPEASLSAFLKMQLELRLQLSGKIVNREVQTVKATRLGAGPRVDLLVDAVLREGGGIRLVIEVKGAWNKDLKTSLHKQLLGTYLKDYPGSAGLYLVGWYDPAEWTFIDRRRSQAVGPSRSMAKLSALLSKQAGEATGDRLGRVDYMILQVPSLADR